MIDRIKYMLGKHSKQAVFVIGTGRSGTHWLGNAVSSHPEIKATIEVEPMFGLSTSMAINAEREDMLYGKLVNSYKKQLIDAYPRIYMDKSHPNIWIAERLKVSFPQSLFIGIERDPYSLTMRG